MERDPNFPVAFWSLWLPVWRWGLSSVQDEPGLPLAHASLRPEVPVTDRPFLRKTQRAPQNEAL